MKSKDKIFQIAEEIVFVKLLASNDQKLRDRAIKKLSKWIASKSKNKSTAFTDDDFIRIWEGLFFSMWMSDKPLIQEECAEKISHLIESFSTEESALSFIRCFYHTMTNKWSTIDTFRLDKFAMLVRRFTRQSLVLCKKHGWNDNLPQEIALFINRHQIPQGLFFHFCDIIIEEICKVAGDELSDDILIKFMKPFFKKLAETKNRPLASYMRESVLKQLIDLTNVANEYREKFKVWKQTGFKGGKISVIQKVEPENGNEDEEMCAEEEEGNVSFDPRPGCVDVVLPVIEINADRYIAVLEEIKQEINKKTPNLRKLFVKFHAIKRGEYPYGMKKVKRGPSIKDDIDAAVERMVNDQLGENDSEKENGEEEDDELNRKISSRKRKRLEKFSPMDFDEIGDIVAGKKGKWNIVNVPEKNSAKESSPTKKICDDWKVSTNVKKQNKRKFPEQKNIVSDNKHTWKVLNTSDKIKQNVSNPLKTRENLNMLKDVGECWWKIIPLDKEDETNKAENKKNKETSKKKKNVQNGNATYNGEPIGAVLTVPDKLKHLSSGDTKKEKIVYPAMKSKGEIKKTSVTTSDIETPVKPQNKRLSILKTPGSSKRLSIRLDMNTSQEVEEHLASLASNNKVFDANQRPPFGVLKPSPIPSPINPFYGKKKMRSSMLF